MPEPSNSDPRRNSPLGYLIVSAIVLGSVVLASLPLFIGLLAPLAIPGVSLRPNTSGWTVFIVLASSFVAWLIITETAELLMKKTFGVKSKRVQEFISLVVSFLVLVFFYGIIVSPVWGAVVSAALASLGYIIASPFIERWYEKGKQD